MSGLKKMIFGRPESEILADLRIRKAQMERKLEEDKTQMMKLEAEMTEAVDNDEEFDDLYDDYVLYRDRVDRKKKMIKAINRVINLFEMKEDLTDDMGVTNLIKEALANRGLETAEIDNALRSLSTSAEKTRDLTEKILTVTDVMRNTMSVEKTSDKEKLREKLRQRKLELKAQIEVEKEKLKEKME